MVAVSVVVAAGEPAPEFPQAPNVPTVTTTISAAMNRRLETILESLPSQRSIGMQIGRLIAHMACHRSVNLGRRSERRQAVPGVHCVDLGL